MSDYFFKGFEATEMWLSRRMPKWPWEEHIGHEEDPKKIEKIEIQSDLKSGETVLISRIYYDERL